MKKYISLKRLPQCIRRYLIVPALAFSTAFSPLWSTAALGAIVYEKAEQEIVTKGVIYEKSRQVTESGLLDVHVLTIDITDPYIDVKPAQSANGYGMKETVSALLNDSGAVAGVNADYFDMSASPVTAFGPVVIDGEVISMESEDGYAALFIDEENNPLIEYLYPEIQFLNNGYGNIKIQAYNKYKTDFTAIIFDSRAMSTTASYDEKFPDMAKIVVEDGYITKIDISGEPVAVPGNGFVVLVAATYFQYFADSVKVGDTAEISYGAAIDFSTIHQAIGGAGKILHNGAYHDTGYVVSPGNRQPRTAIGISQDNTKLIMVAVDGRSHSVGATHQEMAGIMMKFGAWNAMQLDGGGSTTMAVNALDDTALSVVNTLSEGSQRKVVNALGVYNTAPLGALSQIMFNLSSNVVFNGSSIQVNTYGIDEYYNKIAVAPEGVTYSSTDPNGRWEGNVFYPGSLGSIMLMASYGGLTVETVIENTPLAQIDPSTESIKISQGSSVALSFTGTSVTGQSGPVSGVQYEVAPPELGQVVDNVFTATGGQSGYIKCSIGNIVTYIDVSIGTTTESISNFNTNRPVEFIASGDTVTGTVYYNDSVNSPGNNAIALDYTFGVSDTTQAAYVKFTEPIQVKAGASAIQISAYGDNSGRWLRAKLVDADGTDFVVDLSKEVNFTGWQQLTADIPAGAVQPVKLERLYVAALTNTDTATKVIYFDDLMGVYAADYGTVAKPVASKYVNPFKATLEGAGPDITVIGNLVSPGEEKPEDYVQTQYAAINKLLANTTKGYVAGTNDMEGLEGVVQMGQNYSFSLEGSHAVVRLSAASGGLAATSPYYWAFANEAKNTAASHIIIVMDKKPSNFTYKKEYQLFQDALEDIISAGKNVFVVTTEGSETSTNIRNGVNYINIGGLYKGDGTLNNDCAIVRFRVNGNDIKFDVQHVF